VWRVLAIAVTLTGCGRLFDLEPPVLGHGDDDAAVGTDDGRIDSAIDAALSDGPPDGPGFPATCPSTYTITVVGGSKYRLVTANKPWDSAQADCLADQLTNSSRHTHLAVVTDNQEIAAIAAVVAGDTFVGLSDRITEGAYIWVTDEITAFPGASGAPWGTNEPLASATADCVTESPNGALRVVDCGNSRDYICECDAYAADPTRY
jgi:hypothetical protein